MEHNEVNVGIIAVPITSICNLNCALCSFAVPYIERRRHLSIEAVCADIKRAFELCDRANHIDLMGGEPLLHPGVSDILRDISKYREKCSEARILSNCTLVPKESLLNAISEIMDKGMKFLFYLDCYGEHSPKFEEIVTALDNREIPYRITRYFGEDQWCNGWVDFGFHENPPPIKWVTQEEQQTVYDDCAYPLMRMWEVYGGKIFPCGYTVGISALGRPCSEQDAFVDLYNQQQSISEKRKILLHWQSREKPYEACKYCSGLGSRTPRVPAGIQKR